MNFDDFVSFESTPLFKNKTGKSTVGHLLWGDGVKFDGAAGSVHVVPCEPGAD